MDGTCLCRPSAMPTTYSGLAKESCYAPAWLAKPGLGNWLRKLARWSVAN